jgi:long-chain acyl-CoA synthetase
MRGYKSNSDNIGLFSINRAEWIITEHACHRQGLCTVPLYDTLGDEAIEYIVNLCEISIIFCTADKAGILVKLASKLKTLKTIVIFDAFDASLKTHAGFTYMSFEQFENEGKTKPVARAEVDPSAYATISFTSGTTGLPKGVLITHKNLLVFLK